MFVNINAYQMEHSTIYGYTNDVADIAAILKCMVDVLE